jgi:hypothetical protein
MCVEAADGPGGRASDPEMEWGAGDSIVGGYGKGARARQDRAERKCATISTGIGDDENGWDRSWIISTQATPSGGWTSTYRAISRFPSLADSSDGAALPRHRFPEHIARHSAPFRAVVETLDGVPVHSDEQMHIAQDLHQATATDAC